MYSAMTIDWDKAYCSKEVGLTLPEGFISRICFVATVPKSAFFEQLGINVSHQYGNLPDICPIKKSLSPFEKTSLRKVVEYSYESIIDRNIISIYCDEL